MRIKQATPETEEDANVQFLARDYVSCRRAYEDVKRQLQEAEAELVKVMQAKQQKSTRVTVMGQQHSLTYTERTTTVVNEAGLRKAMGVKTFNKYSVKKLDKKALEEGLEKGEVDPNLVAQFVESKVSEPFLTYRPKDVVDE